MTMRRRQSRTRNFRSGRKRRTSWIAIPKTDVFNLPAATLAMTQLDTNVPNFLTTPYTILRTVLSLAVVPTGAPPNIGGSWSAGLLVVTNNEVASFVGSTFPPDPETPSRDYLRTWTQHFNRLATYAGDLAMNTDVDVTQRRRLREEDRYVLAFSNDTLTSGPLDYHVWGRILVAFP